MKNEQMEREFEMN